MKQLLRAAVTALCAVSALNGMALAQETAPMETLPPVGPPVEVTEVPSPLPTSTASVAAASVAATPAQRYFLLLFDSPIGSLTQLDEVGAAVEGWLSTDLLPTDAVAVVSYYGQDLQIAQDFTRDREALRVAVDDAIRGRSHQGISAQGDGPSLLEHLPQGSGLGVEARTESFYGALQLLAGAVDSVPGPKKLLVFSRGFGRARAPEPEPVAGFSGGFSGMLAGPELGIAAETLAESPVLEKYLPSQTLYEPTLEALLSREIQLYPFDLATDYRETFPLAGVMSRLAAETDGRYVYPVTDLPAQLQQVARTAETAGERLAIGPVAPTADRLQE